MSDLVNGREMLKRYQEDLCYGIACKECSMCTEDGGCRIEEWIDKFPSANTDLSEYSDKLWKIAYERGKADRPQGEWVEVCKRTEQYDREGVKTWAVIYQCPTCGFVLNAIENHTAQYNFCPSCGARMKGADDE